MIECSKFATEILGSKVSLDIQLKLGSILQTESTEKSNFSVMAKNIAERFQAAMTEKEKHSLQGKYVYSMVVDFPHVFSEFCKLDPFFDEMLKGYDPESLNLPGAGPMSLDSSGPVGPNRDKAYVTYYSRETEPVWVYDGDLLDSPRELNRYRSMQDTSVLDETYNKTGLDRLNLSASAGISSREQIVALKEDAGDSPLYILSIRQETNAIASTDSGSYAVTLRGPRDWGNLGLTHEEVLQEEAAQIQQLKESEQITLLHGDALKEGKTDPTVVLDKPVIRHEKEIAEELGVHFVRLTVPDHMRPDRKEIDRFLEFFYFLPPNARVHLHCKGGRGRTTQFAIMFDMMVNAKHVSFEDIMRRQQKLNLDYDSTVTPERLKKTDRVMVYVDRWDFLKEFYNFARNRPLDHNMFWTDWRMQGAIIS